MNYKSDCRTAKASQGLLIIRVELTPTPLGIQFYCIGPKLPLFSPKKGCRASLTKEEKGPQLSFVGHSRTGKDFTMMDYTVVYSVGEGLEDCKGTQEWDGSYLFGAAFQTL